MKATNFAFSSVLVFVFGSMFSVSIAAEDDPIRFNRDIRPVLTDKCFACHGPDAETVEGGLRLDLAEEAKGTDAIIPGDPDASEVIRRIYSDDEDEVMPPPHLHKPVSDAERDLLRRWIAQGAEYKPHWAYAPLPREADKDTNKPTHELISNVVDRFVDARLKTENVAPVPEADRITLIRRLSFDLTGMPPTLAEVEAFLSDASPTAYQKLVDRLLDSPRFGERMAIYWLDLVRYADTAGYHGDQNVSQSPYRDYVINAFNDNMPYDRFVREQLAGDLLPAATIDQQVASGYNRLNQTTEEGGAQAKEYLSIYFADRVRNVSQVFMGATMGCAQCHDHKFDPYTARDFYAFGAFFADIEEKGVYSARKREPTIRVLTEEQRGQLSAVDQKIAEIKSEIDQTAKALLSQPEWETALRQKLPESREVETIWIDDSQDTGGTTTGTWKFVTADQGPVHGGKRSRRQNSDGLVQHDFLSAKQKVKVSAGSRFFSWLFLDPDDLPTAVMLQINDGSWEHRAVWGSDDIPFGRKTEDWAGNHRLGKLPAANQWVRLEVKASEVGLVEGSEVQGLAFTQFGGLVHWDEAGWVDIVGAPTEVVEALAVAPDQRSEVQTKVLQDFHVSRSEPMIASAKELAKLETERVQIEESAPLTVVSKSVKPRTIRVQHRGNWMDDSGEIVTPAIPAFLGKLETGDQRATRLDLANWLCRPDNPLTSRTMTNRLWRQMFGRGICTSVDDLGGQGTYPSYPDLLDRLSVEFIDSGWDVKHILRQIANSETYRRSSKASPLLRESDPYNDLFARQGRFRVSAEMVRDSALAISGLLVEQIGGQSVRPYQPERYYEQLNFPKRTYEADEGVNQYRRGVYTHWQRTFLHPMLKAFDAPSREECTAARSRSNTPLQALTLLNDPTFVEAARVFATRILHKDGTTVRDRINWAYRTAVSSEPSQSVVDELENLYEQHLKHYRSNTHDAKKLISHGSAPIAGDLDAAELAAWTSVARVVLNLHETITRY